jgi:hypothetical protein
VADSPGDAEEVAGAQGEGLAVEGMLAFAGDDVEQLLAVGMEVGAVVLARVDVDEAKGLLAAGLELGIAEPADGPPGEGLELSAAGAGEER